MISEVDVRDWERSISLAREAVDNMDDLARMDIGVNPFGSRTCLETFISKVEKFVIGEQKQIAALFKPPKGTE